MINTIGVGLVDPITPLRPGLVRVKAATWRERLEPSRVHSGHCQPTGAWIMHSVQMGRLQCPQSTEAGRSAWR